jgi:hypothetical protein
MYYLKIIQHNESFYDINDIYYDPIFSNDYNYLLKYLKVFILDILESNYFTYCDDYPEERKYIEDLIDNIDNIKDLENQIKYKYLCKRYNRDEYVLEFTINKVKL